MVLCLLVRGPIPQYPGIPFPAPKLWGMGIALKDDLGKFGDGDSLKLQGKFIPVPENPKHFGDFQRIFEGFPEVEFKSKMQKFLATMIVLGL